jgi:Glycosyltransferase family 87
MSIHPQRIKILIALLLGAMLLLQLSLAWNFRRLLQKGYSDFATLYAAGKIVRQGLGPHLYDTSVQFRVQQEFAADVEFRKGAAFPYLHPPFEALVFVPFSELSYFRAYLLWDLLNVLLLCFLPRVLRPSLAVLQKSPLVGWIFLSLAFFPVFISLLQGQDIICLLFIMAFVFASLRKGHDFTSGIWLGLGLFRFHLVLPLLLVLLIRGKRKVVLGFALVALVLAITSLALMGWNGLLAYPGYVLHIEKILDQAGTTVPDMPSLRGFVAAIFGTQLWSQALVAFASLGLVILAAVLWRPTNGEGDFDLGFSVSVITTVLVSYHSFIYDLSLLLLPFLILANHFQAIRESDAWTRWALVAPAVLLFLSPLQIVLAFRYARAGLLVPVLLWWLWGIARLLTRLGNTRVTNPRASPSLAV